MSEMQTFGNASEERTNNCTEMAATKNGESTTDGKTGGCAGAGGDTGGKGGPAFPTPLEKETGIDSYVFSEGIDLILDP